MEKLLLGETRAPTRPGYTFRVRRDVTRHGACVVLLRNRTIVSVVPLHHVRTTTELLRAALGAPRGIVGEIEYRVQHPARPRYRLRFAAGDPIRIQCRHLSLVGIRWFGVSVPRSCAADLVEILDAEAERIDAVD